MLQSLANKLQHFIITLRFSLLSIVITLFFIMMLTLLSIFHFQISKLVMHATLLLFDKTAATVQREFEAKLQPAVAVSEFSANNIGEGVLDVNNQTEMVRYMVHLLEKMPMAYGVFWGNIQGNAIYVYREKEGGFSTLFTERNGSSFTHGYLYWDQSHQAIKRIINPIHFDPFTRPWFKLALAKKQTIWTDTDDVNSATPSTSVTVATPVIQQNHPVGVFSIDIKMGNFSNYLAQLKIGQHGEIVMLDKSGQVLGAPALLPDDQVLVPVAAIQHAYTLYQRTSETQHIFSFQYEGVDYLSTFYPVPMLAENGWSIAIIDRMSDFTRGLNQARTFYLLLSALIFVIGIGLISHLLGRVVHPIKKLVKETEKIKNFNLEETQRIHSHIKEVIEISNALYAMKMGLRSFQKYVPASLVRQLIKAGEDVKIGGTKRELAVFFSDIQNFTAITERADANQLMRQVCDYLDAFSHLITEERGTIDKFIGDAIMAFWGAPLTIKHPCEHACLAALHCMQRLQELNALWVQEDKPLFFTRIGIHYGEAIVGNLGSSERLNYTALGDTVNTTSRLVNANKLYGTSILVSEPVYKEIKDAFILRMIDQVMLKGKAESTIIYELLGEGKQSMLFDVVAYEKLYVVAFQAYQAQQWQEAIILFERCIHLYPQDTVAPVFIQRCQKLAMQPLAADWNGIWHFNE